MGSRDRSQRHRSEPHRATAGKRFLRLSSYLAQPRPWHRWLHRNDRKQSRIPAPLARSIWAACARPTAGVGISALSQWVESSSAAGSCPALIGLASLLAQVLEFHVDDRVELPILIVEVPPLIGDDFEALLFHGVAQKGTTGALIGSSAWIVGICAIGHLVIPTWHLHFLARPQIIERQIDRAAAVVL